MLIDEIIVNAKLEILERSDEEEDEFTAVYTRLVKVFRGRIRVTVVFPHAVKLLKEVPPETLGAYNSLSRWSCFKADDSIEDNWLKRGSELLREATDEQYLKKGETQTELARREKTIIRQEIADEAMASYLSSEKSRIGISQPDLREQLQSAKEEAIRDGLRRWKAMEDERVKDAEEQKERLLRAHQLYKYYEKDRTKETDLHHWSLLLGGGIAVAIIAFTIIKGYQGK